jgi:hypothetical protein
MTDPAVLASDTERERAAALLQRHYATGRLTVAEVEERLAAAYAARTRDQLQALTADLPVTAEESKPARKLDPGLLCLLFCCCPPAGIVYLLLTRHKDRAV